MSEKRQAEHPAPALVTLARGIGHEVNNLVLAIDLNLSGLRDIVGDDAEAIDVVTALEEIADQAKNIAHSLLIFAGRQPLEPEPIDLAGWLPVRIGEFSTIWGTDSLALALVEGRPVIEADSRGLMVALLTMMRVAVASGATRGDLAVAIIPRNPDLDFVSAYAVISLKDNGRGMGETARKAAFDPVLAPHAAPAYPGLGLCEVDGFVRQSGGYSSLDSEEGLGTTVNLHFPITSGA